MKLKLFSLFAILGLALSLQSSAASPQAQTARLKFSTTPVLTTGYTQLIASTTEPVGTISYQLNGPVPLQLALGAAGSESVQLTISSTGSSTVVQLPFLIPAGQRVSVIALDGSEGTTGDLQVNFLFH